MFRPPPPVHRLWDIECGACLRVLEGHEELVRCIRFDSKRIVSGAYDGKIKVWDLVAALDPRAQASALCLKTLVVRCSVRLSATLTCFPFFFSPHLHIESSKLMAGPLGAHWSRISIAIRRIPNCKQFTR